MHVHVCVWLCVCGEYDTHKTHKSLPNPNGPHEFIHGCFQLQQDTRGRKKILFLPPPPVPRLVPHMH